MSLFCPCVEALILLGFQGQKDKRTYIFIKVYIKYLYRIYALKNNKKVIKHRKRKMMRKKCPFVLFFIKNHMYQGLMQRTKKKIQGHNNNKKDELP